MDAYTIHLQTPSIETYQLLRKSAGLSAKNEDAVRRALPNTLFAVQILYDGNPIGMGRVVGDDGCFYQVVDIAVLPEHQGRGLCKRIMREVSDYIQEHVPKTAYVSLLADGKAQDLYAQFGFQLTAPNSVGMALKK